MAGASRKPRKRVMKIRSGDEVQVMSGKDRGKRGLVLRVQPAKERVYVEGLNLIKRHVPVELRKVPDKKTGGFFEEEVGGGVEESEGPIHISNVMLVDPKDGKPTRIGIEREGGRRYRVAKRSGTRLDWDSAGRTEEEAKS